MTETLKDQGRREEREAIKNAFKDLLLSSYQDFKGVVFDPEKIVAFKMFLGMEHKFFKMESNCAFCMMNEDAETFEKLLKLNLISVTGIASCCEKHFELFMNYRRKVRK